MLHHSRLVRAIRFNLLCMLPRSMLCMLPRNLRCMLPHKLLCMLPRKSLCMLPPKLLCMLLPNAVVQCDVPSPSHDAGWCVWAHLGHHKVHYNAILVLYEALLTQCNQGVAGSRLGCVGSPGSSRQTWAGQSASGARQKRRSCQRQSWRHQRPAAASRWSHMKLMKGQ